MSRALCPARGPWEDPACDGKSSSTRKPCKVRLPGQEVKEDRRILRYDALSVDGVLLPMSRGLSPARGPWEDPARDGKVRGT